MIKKLPYWLRGSFTSNEWVLSWIVLFFVAINALIPPFFWSAASLCFVSIILLFRIAVDFDFRPYKGIFTRLSSYDQPLIKHFLDNADKKLVRKVSVLRFVGWSGMGFGSYLLWGVSPDSYINPLLLPLALFSSIASVAAIIQFVVYSFRTS